jgi:ABC-type nitrate/sulfonate/bicarbonate transport system ATPase subunit
MKSTTALTVSKLTKSFDGTLVLGGLDLVLEENEIVAVLGPSGCGKSTLLRCLVGLEDADSGSIEIASTQGVQAIGYLFQKPILYPHLNVAGNISLGFNTKRSKEEQRNIIAKELSFIQMEGFEKRRVESLSGGEAQRVALVRAMLGKPEVLLLDEPFSALDLETRRSLAIETRAWLKKRMTAAIHVTHDPEEARLIADRVLSWEELIHGEEE